MIRIICTFFVYFWPNLFLSLSTIYTCLYSLVHYCNNLICKHSLKPFLSLFLQTFLIKHFFI
ncbi:hypothetical protein MtrunA17_Chr4g0030871 [Medicago truncatula]|uniref:Transmembrane protein n=1 Tax=Medicago truncatula TaxID=3880 RepID=A0A396I847_MEDTR|nr:hypothetical protein MtrunA17_Chr4g0030871 [Medicago truncatula]